MRKTFLGCRLLAVFLGATSIGQRELALEAMRQPDPGSAPGHVRSTDRRLRAALLDGLERSSSLREINAALNAAAVIVSLEEGSCRGALACTMIIKLPRQVQTRLLRINFVFYLDGDSTPLWRDRNRLIATIAHELQHALEISDDPQVVDEATLARLFQRIGWWRVGDGVAFETAAALMTQRTVLSELSTSTIAAEDRSRR